MKDEDKKVVENALFMIRQALRNIEEVLKDY